MMEKLIKKLNNRKGFTLIELIVVIAIIGILAAILIPQFTGFSERAARTQVVTDAKQIATAIDSLIAESTGGSITAASSAVTDAKDKVVELSGVPLTRLTSFTYGATGDFEFKYKPRDVEYTAKRASSNAAVTVTP